MLAIALFAATALLIVGSVLFVNRKLRRLRRMLRRQEQHVWETHNVFRVLDGRAPLPAPGGWAASTDLLGEAVRAIMARRPQLVVELGSGLSTLVVASALRSLGTGRLISVDADADYAALTHAQLQQHALADWAQLRIAPLKQLVFEGVARPWYDTAMLEDLQGIDLLLIDGPPTALRADIRYPALPFFRHRLSAGAIVLLDDAARPAERDIARRWQRSFPEAGFDYLRYEKGALRVTTPR